MRQDYVRVDDSPVSLGQEHAPTRGLWRILDNDRAIQVSEIGEALLEHEFV